jgi:hypothetical protein
MNYLASFEIQLIRIFGIVLIRRTHLNKRNKGDQISLSS